MSHHKDTDYLAISSRIHAMENRLLTAERMEHMLEAKDTADAVKVLAECGYTEMERLSQSGLEQMLAKARVDLFHELIQAVPDKRVIEVFQLKYDYHNCKALLKARAKGQSAQGLLLHGGRYDPAALLDWYERDDLRDVSPVLRQAVTEAKESLAGTGDPQRADFLMDRACYEEMSALAAGSESPFLQGYVRLLVDVANLRTVVRSARLEKGSNFLKLVLLPGGNVDEQTLANLRAEEGVALFQSGALAAAAAAGIRLISPEGGAMTEFERLGDDAMTEYLASARLIPFGEQAVICYLYAKESELVAIRTILSGRMAGLDSDTIRGRLRTPWM